MRLRLFTACGRCRWGRGRACASILVGLGQRGDFTAALFQRSSSWQSATPFSGEPNISRSAAGRRTPRSCGRRARRRVRPGGSSWKSLGRLRHRGPKVPEPARVEFLPEGRMGAHRLRPIQFKRFRRRKPGDDGRAIVQRRLPHRLSRSRWPAHLPGPIRATSAWAVFVRGKWDVENGRFGSGVHWGDWQPRVVRW